MIIMGLRLMLIGIVLGCTDVTVSWGEDSDLPSSVRPFQIGERFSYEISWMHITAGTAVMSVIAETDGNRSLVKLVTTAESKAPITTFFPVDNRIESILDAETLLPKHMSFRRREGKKKEDIAYTFHQKEGTVIEVKGESTDTLPILPETHDAISCLYYLRSELTPYPGSSLRINVHHDKKNYTLEVSVEEIETLSGSWGEVETVRVLVVMPGDGLFRNRGHIRVWFTNDHWRIPVRMEAKVIIGTMVADLVSELPAPTLAQQSTVYAPRHHHISGGRTLPVSE